MSGGTAYFSARIARRYMDGVRAFASPVNPARRA